MTSVIVVIIPLVLGAVTSAIGYLFKTVMKQADKQIEQAKQIGELKGNQQGIKILSAEVLATVEKAIKKGKEETVTEDETS